MMENRLAFKRAECGRRADYFAIRRRASCSSGELGKRQTQFNHPAAPHPGRDMSSAGLAWVANHFGQIASIDRWRGGQSAMKGWSKGDWHLGDQRGRQDLAPDGGRHGERFVQMGRERQAVDVPSQRLRWINAIASMWGWQRGKICLAVCPSSAVPFGSSGRLAAGRLAGCPSGYTVDLQIPRAWDQAGQQLDKVVLPLPSSPHSQVTPNRPGRLSNSGGGGCGWRTAGRPSG
jgi:hypothetical protein